MKRPVEREGWRVARRVPGKKQLPECKKSGQLAFGLTVHLSLDDEAGFSRIRECATSLPKREKNGPYSYQNVFIRETTNCYVFVTIHLVSEHLLGRSTFGNIPFIILTC